jgi:hypothetical protein
MSGRVREGGDGKEGGREGREGEGREGKGRERERREGIGSWDGWMEEGGRGFAYASLEGYSTRSVQSSPVQARRRGLRRRLD